MCFGKEMVGLCELPGKTHIWAIGVSSLEAGSQCSRVEHFRCWGTWVGTTTDRGGRLQGASMTTRVVVYILLPDAKWAHDITSC